MDRGWYTRAALVFLSIVGGWFALWPSLDTWVPAPPAVKNVFKGRISPGLDIRGGLRLMYEVDVQEYIRDQRDRRMDSLLERIGVKFGLFKAEETPTREKLAEVRKKVQIDRDGERRIRAKFVKTSDADKLDRDMLRNMFPDLREVSRQNGEVILTMREDRLEELRDNAVSQTVKTISNRIDELQIREMTVIGRESDIIVEIPGEDEVMFEKVRSIIGRTAKLEFKIVDDETDVIGATANVPPGITTDVERSERGASHYLRARGKGSKIRLQAYMDSLRIPEDRQVLLGPDEAAVGDGNQREEAWRTYTVFRRADVTGEDLKQAFVDFDQQNFNQPVVAFQLQPDGASKFEKLTGDNLKKRMAIVLDGRVESAPMIQSRIGSRGQITLGSYRSSAELQSEARDLAIVLNAGALPAPIRPANEQLIGPTLGKDSIIQGAQGALLGIVLVLIFMGIYYQVAGVVADVMVVLNVLLLLALLAVFEATLTLPGIAGIALTVGMAVDANVLITERIREELRIGKSPRAAVDQGFSRAFWSIFDSQLTTFIAGVVLFQYGTGPIKGFAVTLTIGIVTSLYTGVFCSRVMMDWIARGLKVQRLPVG